jgi:hypothetical protein
MATEEWTDEGSRACQFILLLNVRTIHAIARLLGEEIADIIERRNAETPTNTSGTSSQAESATKFTPAFNRVLPLLRVYMTWLCSYGPQLVQFRPHLEPQFGTMSTTLSNTLTLLFELLGGEQQLGDSVPWRFPEDELTLGIECLNGPDLHDGCQLYYDAFTRKPKPRREEVSRANHTDDDITFTRALDVLLCALDLSAPESTFPFATSTVTKGSREFTTFVYLEGGKPEPTQVLPAVQHPVPAAAPPTVEQVPQIPVVAPSPCESNELSEDQEFYGPDLRHAAAGNGSHNGKAPAAVGPMQVAPVSEFPIDRQLYNILNDFINPPESTPVAKPQTPRRPAAQANPYGMDSAAVAEAFGAGASISPAPGSAGAKTFPGLPWDYFYTPEPMDSALRNPATSGTRGGWGANGAGFPRPTSGGNAAHLGTGTTTGNPLAHHTHQRYDSFGRTKLVENPADALRSLDLGSDGVRQPQQGYGASGLWPNTAAAGMTSTHSPQQSIWAPSASPWQTAYGQNPAATTATGGVPNSPFSTLNFSAAASSLPQVNSPWGLSTTAQRFSATQSPSSPSFPGAMYPGVSAPSPSTSKYVSDYATAVADQQASPGFAGAWPDARQPRTGSGSGLGPGQQRRGLDIWGNPVRQPTVGEQADGKLMQGMPKR